MDKIKKYAQHIVRGISDRDWRQIKIQSIAEGCRNIGEYIYKVHREHVDQLNK